MLNRATDDGCHYESVGSRVEHEFESADMAAVDVAADWPVLGV
jgi:hypothetical protein